MLRITISYHRNDSVDITGGIFDRLAGHFGREAVFRDIDNIPPGVDFRRHIDRVLGESDIVLAIVGPRWLGPDSEQHRLANPADPVRLEIGGATGAGLAPREDARAAPAFVVRTPWEAMVRLVKGAHTMVNPLFVIPALACWCFTTMQLRAVQSKSRHGAVRHSARVACRCDGTRCGNVLPGGVVPLGLVGNLATKKGVEADIA